MAALGLDNYAAMGNRRNDEIMFYAAPGTLAAADASMGGIINGLELLTKSKRLSATLRR